MNVLPACALHNEKDSKAKLRQPDPIRKRAPSCELGVTDSHFIPVVSVCSRLRRKPLKKGEYFASESVRTRAELCIVWVTCCGETVLKCCSAARQHSVACCLYGACTGPEMRTRKNRLSYTAPPKPR